MTGTVDWVEQEVVCMTMTDMGPFPYQSIFFAQYIGWAPGIYTDWLECKAQVDGFPNAKYKGFAQLYQGLKCIIFDKYAYFNADDIATIFNIAMNCTGHSILQHLADGNSEEIRRDLDKMQTLGY